MNYSCCGLRAYEMKISASGRMDAEYLQMRAKNDTNYDNIYNTNEQRVDMTMMLDISCFAP